MSPPATSAASGAPSSAAQPQTGEAKARSGSKKKKNHRGGKKKRSRRKSFAVLHEDSHDEIETQPTAGLYQIPDAKLSRASVDSEALLDHREHQPMRLRRSSTVGGPSPFQQPYPSTPGSGSRLRPIQTANSEDGSVLGGNNNEHVPLLSESVRYRGSPGGLSGYGAGYVTSESRTARNRSRRASSRSSRVNLPTAFGPKDTYDVNNPPSMPGSPTFDPADLNFGDALFRDELALRSESPENMLEGSAVLSDADGQFLNPRGDRDRARKSHGEADVCFPGPGMSDLGEDDLHAQSADARRRRPRRRRGQWPDLSILEEWKHFEKEDRSDERRAKQITEPQLINGRLRPVRKGWFQTDEEAPFRFTYFNEEFPSTIHSQTISELVQPGSDFRELFIPDPRILSDDESETDDNVVSQAATQRYRGPEADLDSKISTRQPSIAESRREDLLSSPIPKEPPPSHPKSHSDLTTPADARSKEGSVHTSNTAPPVDSAEQPPKPVRYGDRPVWWLDVLCPTEEEMKVISKAFGIHPLTAEDIMLQEAREKVELFRHYYFVNYRTFDQDINSENYLEPVNMYVVVFREGVLSFHFSVTPHPANVRRRIRQLTDYLILSSDWISYAIIDDITDVFQPLIQNIEDEVDEIDDVILKLHSSSDKRLKDHKQEPSKGDDNITVMDPSGDMLRRVGDCRKRVMSLYRLLGNKADVIKGFAKRCNERWEVAPRSEIGLYLGDIQDHIITMTSNLGHYEKILARSHGNYLAQINIRMNERQEQTADVLGKLTVLGTIVLPMNIITGLWGMNVWVPGQEYEGDLTWFVWITVGLIMFGLSCYITAKRVYGIV